MDPSTSGLLSLTPGAWKSSDGNWSTFTVTVGDVVSFDILPSMGASQIWVPNVQLACLPTDTFDCPDSRGIGSNDSLEQLANWKGLGYYSLQEIPPLFNLSVTDNATYGFGSITWSNDSNGGHDQIETQATFAAYASGAYWLGLLGLNTSSTEFPAKDLTQSSPLVSLKKAEVIGSLSYGYTAGASYVEQGAAGSLTLGGYDRARIKSHGINVTISNPAQGLQVHLSLLTVSSDVSGLGRSLLPSDGISATVESSTSQLWMPSDICQMFVEAFGITYDNSTGLYLYSKGSRQKLLDNNASLTFTIDTGQADNSTKIVLPFAAFNLTANQPLYDGDQPYFPLRNATPASGNILGRVFLQEAYVVVDRERNVFSVSPTTHDTGNRQLVSIPPASVISTPSTTTTPKSDKSTILAKGEIAGIVVPCLVLLFAFVALTWRIRHRRNRERERKASTEAATIGTVETAETGWDKAELMATESKKGRFLELDFLRGEEADSTQLLEMCGSGPERELMSNELLEMEGDLVQRDVKKQADAEDAIQTDGDEETQDKVGDGARSVHELE